MKILRKLAHSELENLKAGSQPTPWFQDLRIVSLHRLIFSRQISERICASKYTLKTQYNCGRHQTIMLHTWRIKTHTLQPEAVSKEIPMVANFSQNIKTKNPTKQTITTTKLILMSHQFVIIAILHFSVRGHIT